MRKIKIDSEQVLEIEINDITTPHNYIINGDFLKQALDAFIKDHSKLKQQIEEVYKRNKMTAENLKKANELSKRVEDMEKIIKNLSKKNAVKILSLKGSYEIITSLSMDYMNEDLKVIADSFIEATIKHFKSIVERLQKEISDL